MTTFQTLDFLEHRWPQIKERLGAAQWPDFVTSYRAAVASVPSSPSRDDLEGMVEVIKQLIVSAPATANIWWNWESNLIASGIRGASTYEEMLQENDGNVADTVETLINRFEHYGEKLQESLPDTTPPSPGNAVPSSSSAPSS